MRKNEKKYNEFEKSYPQQLDLFSFSNIFENKKEKYSNTVELYDIMPKYFHGDVEKIRTIDGLLKSLNRNFIFRKQNLSLKISPALVDTKDGEKAFYPSQREEIIEDVLRKFATDPNKNEFLDDRLSVRFTLYDLWKELRSVRHPYDYSEIKEALEILSKTNIEVKTCNNKITFSSNMFETFGIVDENDNNNFKIQERLEEEQSKKITYFVRFNSLVSESIKNKSWKILNYDQCIKYRKVISRWLHKRISHMFMTNSIELPYNILLSTIIRDSGMTEYGRITDNMIQVQKCLAEMIEIGSIDRYEIEKIYNENKKNKIGDTKFLIYVSHSFFDDMKFGNLIFKGKVEASLTEKNNINNKFGKTSNEIILDTSNNISDNEIKNLLKDFNISEKELNKILLSKKEKSSLDIKNNIFAAMEYIKKEKENNKECKTIAILTKAIKDNWQPNIKDEQKDLFPLSAEDKEKLINEKINNFIIKQPDNNIKLLFEKMLKTFGNSVFYSWLMQMKYVGIEDNIITFSVETEFMQEWITKNFLNGIKRKKEGEIIWFTNGIEQLSQQVYLNIKKVQIIVVKKEEGN